MATFGKHLTKSFQDHLNNFGNFVGNDFHGLAGICSKIAVPGVHTLTPERCPAALLAGLLLPHATLPRAAGGSPPEPRGPPAEEPADSLISPFDKATFLSQ